MPRAWVLAILLILPPALAVTWSRVGESRSVPHRFAEVVPGQIFRGGMPSADDIRSLTTEKKIHTVVALTKQTDKPDDMATQREINRLGLRLLRFEMPGNGVADFNSMDRAADAIADRSNWPVFFHCAAGKQRSNAALFAYRIRKCGWTVERALGELEREYGLDPVEERPLVNHLRRYAARITAEESRPATRIGVDPHD